MYEKKEGFQALETIYNQTRKTKVDKLAGSLDQKQSNGLLQ